MLFYLFSTCHSFTQNVLFIELTVGNSNFLKRDTCLVLRELYVLWRRHALEKNYKCILSVTRGIR